MGKGRSLLLVGVTSTARVAVEAAVLPGAETASLQPVKRRLINATVNRKPICLPIIHSFDRHFTK
jgi:hypothetical protein